MRELPDWFVATVRHAVRERLWVTYDQVDGVRVGGRAISIIAASDPADVIAEHLPLHSQNQLVLEDGPVLSISLGRLLEYWGKQPSLIAAAQAKFGQVRDFITSDRDLTDEDRDAFDALVRTSLTSTTRVLGQFKK